jgi:hypothetical protein
MLLQRKTIIHDDNFTNRVQRFQSGNLYVRKLSHFAFLKFVCFSVLVKSYYGRLFSFSDNSLFAGV